MTEIKSSQGSPPRRLRSQMWFDNPDNPGMTALYLERYLNYGLTRAELTSGKPIIGIAQTGSDLSPCNRHPLELAKRVREGMRDAGGVAFEFPVHPLQETGKRPTAALDSNLAYLGLVEALYGYFFDGVVLITEIGVAFEFPVHPLQETGKRPTAALDSNLAYLGLVEALYGYFFDGVVLMT